MNDRNIQIDEHGLAYWATVDLYRTWLAEDGPLLMRLKEATGGLDAELLGRIARSYSVSRTIPGADAHDGSKINPNLKLCAERIVELAAAWPSKGDGPALMIERAERCRSVATALQDEFSTWDVSRKKIAPHSAVTKFIWFLRPADWTVFDSYAASAVLKNGGNAAERQERFYCQIADDFARLVPQIGPLLAPFDASLHAERLIDKLLMLRGRSDVGEAVCVNRHFLSLLPDDLRVRVDQCASEIDGAVPTDAFPKETAARRGRRN